MPPGPVHELLAQLVREDPGRPRITWYGPDHERVELSGKTLQNWVAKTANLLLDELETGPGSTVGIDLPVHWRSAVWLLATWAAGGHAVVPPAAMLEDEVDVVVTPHVAAPPSVRAGALVVVALPALATRYSGELLPGAVDAAAEVRLQPDAFVQVVRPDPATPALTVPGDAGRPSTLTYAELFDTSGASGAAGAAGRVLTGAGPERAAAAYLAPLLVGGSVVLHHDLAGLDPGEREHLVAQEGVTGILPGV